MHSVYDNLKNALTLRLATYTADQGGQVGIDTKGFNSAKAVVTVGAINLASNDETYVFNVQESDDDGNSDPYANVTDENNVVILSVPITASDTQAAIRIEGLGTSRKRYLRIHLAAGGTTPSIACEAHLELGRAFSDPVE